MAFDGLIKFISFLDSKNELLRVKAFVNPLLEVTEMADRVVKADGKALLFENTGTDFPLLINAFASDTRMAAAIGRPTIDDAGEEITSLFDSLGAEKSLLQKISGAPRLLNLLKINPKRISGHGACQEIVMEKPDLGNRLY